MKTKDHYRAFGNQVRKLDAEILSKLLNEITQSKTDISWQPMGSGVLLTKDGY